MQCIFIFFDKPTHLCGSVFYGRDPSVSKNVEEAIAPK